MMTVKRQKQKSSQSSNLGHSNRGKTKEGFAPRCRAPSSQGFTFPLPETTENPQWVCIWGLCNLGYLVLLGFVEKRQAGPFLWSCLLGFLCPEEMAGNLTASGRASTGLGVRTSGFNP